MTKNKEIYLIHSEYKYVFQKICQKAIDKYNNTLPIVWEDIYYNFLYLVPDILKKFDPLTGVSKKTFLFLECQYFANNQCRKYSSKNHIIMNLRTNLRHENSLFLSDSQKIHQPLDLSLLKDFELKVYKLHFLEEKNVTQISIDLNVTYYRARRTIKKIKEKLNSQL